MVIKAFDASWFSISAIVLTSLHVKRLQYYLRRKIYCPWAQISRKSLSIVSAVPGRRIFSLFLVLDVLGMIHQMLREPWCKLEKGSFMWYLIKMTLMAMGVFSRGGFCLIERGRKQVEKEYFGGRILSFLLFKLEFS